MSGETKGEPRLATHESARDMVGTIDAVLTMPIIRMSGHAKKLTVLRAWVFEVDARLARLEEKANGKIS